MLPPLTFLAIVLLWSWSVKFFKIPAYLLPPPDAVFARLIADNITVFADENQRLHENNSTIEQIQTYLGIPQGEVRRLTRN